MTKYIIAICYPFLLSACGNNTTAKTPPPEYVYETTTADFGYSAWNDNKQGAIEKVNQRMDYYSKHACHGIIGYGWTFVKAVNPGKLSCQVHPVSQQVRCRQLSVDLECRRLKPGTVGMGMIPFTQ